MVIAPTIVVALIPMGLPPPPVTALVLPLVEPAVVAVIPLGAILIISMEPLRVIALPVVPRMIVVGACARGAQCDERDSGKRESLGDLSYFIHLRLLSHAFTSACDVALPIGDKDLTDWRPYTVNG
jgi:hypothetical protein